MKAQLIKPPSLREQLKAIANPASVKTAAESGKSLRKESSTKPRKKSKKVKRSPKHRKPKAPRNPSITEVIERLADGIEALEEIFR